MRWSRHRHAPWYLGAVSFTESSFFPIPPDVMLAPMSLANPARAWRFAWITTLASVAGGLFGYAIGYFIMKKLVWDLIDEVYDDGITLLFRNSGKEVRVSLRDIKNVSYSTMTNPPRVTLSIRYKTDLGDEISFSPPASWIPFKKNKDIEELIDRIDKARG